MTAGPTNAHDTLRVFNDPASVAVVGASDNPAKWGFWLARGALEGRHRRSVDLVNHTHDTVLGQPSARSLSELDHPPELVALAVPAAAVSAVVAEGLALGVRGFLGVTAHVAQEADLARRIRDGGARLLGANSLGVYDAETELQLAWGHFRPGPVAIVTQSGQLGSELAIRFARRGIGVSRFVSVGNQSDIDAAEILDQLRKHRSTEVIALYLEGFASGVQLFETLRLLRATGKPTLLLTVGSSAASARLARSHTGSLTAATDLIDAACRAAGVLRVRTPAELVDVAEGFLTVRGTSGLRVGIAGDSGGQCGIAADVATDAGLIVAPFDDNVEQGLAQVVPEGAARENPVDLAGSGEADLTAYATVIESMLADPGIDAAVLTGYFGRYSEDTPPLADRELQVAQRIGEIAQETGKAIVVHSMAPDGPVARHLWNSGIPVVASIEKAVRMIRGLSVLHAEPVAPSPTSSSNDETPTSPGYLAAQQLLTAAGITMPDARAARDRSEIRDAARTLHPPYVLKAGWIEHKTEADGVILGLLDEAQLVAAYDLMSDRLGEGEYVVEEQDTREHCLEIIVGARRDPSLGPVIVLGMGGTDAEVWRDIAIECAPIDEPGALAMINRLRCAPLLHGWRGRPACDIGALAAVAAALSRLVCARVDIAEIELNPVRVGPQGAVAVDALLVPAAPWTLHTVVANDHPHLPDPPQPSATPPLMTTPEHAMEDSPR
ncbi:acetate--CoA ligase family protein [Dermatophilaceae bacterium Sec6.4]